MATFLSLQEAANKLNISRQALFKKIKKGEVPAKKIKGKYSIKEEDLCDIFQICVSKSREKEISKAVKRLFDEYGEALKLLANE
ncbi:MAG: helix-turn-helix domain-containing protein [Candidatus Gracilibacteria bacterium]|jgi:excisionase family DNA binding protein